MSDNGLNADTRIIAVTNQKGGVGKTTTAINLAAALVEEGNRVVIIDLDPQGNASTGLGIGAESRQNTTYDLIVKDTTFAEAVQQTKIQDLFIVPATTDLASADVDLVGNENRAFMLKDALDPNVLSDLGFDYVLIDCPPSLSLLTVNAMVAAQSVLVPLQSEFFALEGLTQLVLSIRQIRETANPDLRIEGVVLTMFDGRNRLSQQVWTDAKENLGDLVFNTIVPRNVRLSEAPSFAMPVLEYDTYSKGSQAYRALAQEIAVRHSGTTR